MDTTLQNIIDKIKEYKNKSNSKLLILTNDKHKNFYRGQINGFNIAISIIEETIGSDEEK